MRKYTLNIFKDHEEASGAAAEAVVAVATAAVENRNRFSVALAGGSSPKLLYKLLTEEPLRSRIDWSKVEFFWGDERPVPIDHEESNFRMANEVLLQPLGIAEPQIHRIRAELTDKDLAAEKYLNEIVDTLGLGTGGEPPSLDLVLLGLGEDAHTASLFPATKALLETQRWVTKNLVLKFDAERITITPMFINRARNVFFLVTGENKATALSEVLEGPIDTVRLPAQLVKPATGQVIWYVDEAAASKLKQKPEGKA
ncbi:MAG: 6-phosphogluconolactonase [Gemmataceae bacterium]